MGFGTPDCAQFRAAISLRLLTAISLRSLTAISLRSHPHLITGLLRHGVECSIKTPAGLHSDVLLLLRISCVFAVLYVNQPLRVRTLLQHNVPNLYGCIIMQ